MSRKRTERAQTTTIVVVMNLPGCGVRNKASWLRCGWSLRGTPRLSHYYGTFGEHRPRLISCSGRRVRLHHGNPEDFLKLAAGGSHDRKGRYCWCFQYPGGGSPYPDWLPVTVIVLGIAAGIIGGANGRSRDWWDAAAPGVCVICAESPTRVFRPSCIEPLRDRSWWFGPLSGS
jgi:hypothetical protein